MKYYNEILDLGCFTRSDLSHFIENKKTLNSLLTRYIHHGFIKRVKHNYYATMDIVNQVPVCNKYAIATNLHESNYISYHSALEYYSFQNQVFHEIVFCGHNKVRDFSFENIDYHFVSSKCDIQIESNYDGVRVTSIERTIIDCIDQIDLAGGIEELYRALDSISNINEDKIMEVLDFYHKKVLYQRAGFILETFKDNLNISDDFLQTMRSRIDTSKCYLLSSKKNGKTIFNNNWNVCVPTYVSSILLKGNIVHEI